MKLSAIGEKIRGKGAQAAILLAVLVLAGSALLPQTDGSTLQSARTETHADTLEARLGEVLSQITGAGRVEVAIQYAQAVSAQESWLSTQRTQARGDPVAVIVVAEGADDVAVRLQLAHAVETLLQLDAANVEVFEMRKGEE